MFAKMKVMTATPNSDVSILQRMQEPIVVYTNYKDVYSTVSNIRKDIDHPTIVIYDVGNKTPNQVILEHRSRLAEHNVTELEPFDLPDVNEIYVPIFIFIVILVVVGILIYSFSKKR